MEGQSLELPDLEGQYDHTVDDKGRLSIPSVFRESLGLSDGAELVVTRNLKDHCLAIYPIPAWEAFKARIAEGRDPVARALQRVVKGSARRVTVDRLGRVHIPPGLRAHARLSGKCYVVGLGPKMEVWDVTVWSDTFDPSTFGDISDEMLGRYEV